MPTATKIEWADATTNTAVGCSHCSPGCDNCYAERFAHRLSKHPVAKKVYAGVVDERGKWTGKINSNFSEKMYPHRVPGKGKRVFVGSMTDIFHPNYPAENRDELFASILADYIFANGHGHTFIILTKRPQAMKEYFAAGPETLLRRWGKAGNGWIIVGDGDSETFEEYADAETIPQEMTSPRSNLRQDYLWPLPNVWIGVTVCNQPEADAKIPALLATPAEKHFVSVEPMLGPVDLTAIRQSNHSGDMFSVNALTGFWHRERRRKESYNDYITSQSAAQQRLTALDWVICGGETGSHARPVNYAWVYKLAEQCWSAGTPFFFKGWGEWTPAFFQPDGGYRVHRDANIPDGFTAEPHVFAENPGIRMYRVGKRHSGRLLNEREWNEIPEVSK